MSILNKIFSKTRKPVCGAEQESSKLTTQRKRKTNDGQAVAWLDSYVVVWSQDCEHMQEAWRSVPIDNNRIADYSFVTRPHRKLKRSLSKISKWRQNGHCVTCGKPVENISIIVVDDVDLRASGPSDDSFVAHFGKQSVVEMGLTKKQRSILDQALDISKHDSTEAIRMLTVLEEQGTRNYDVFYNLGVLLQQSGEPSKGMQWLEKATDVRPEKFSGWLEKGNTWFLLQDFASAEKCYRHAVQVKPSEPIAWNNMGSALQMLGRCEEALSAFSQALSIDPSYNQALVNREELKKVNKNTAAMRTY